jgi:WD40 repeat protein
MPQMLQGHKGEVLDIDFNPFAPHVIATGSDDTTIKVWSVPAEGITAPITASDYTLEGHQKKVTLLNWHPTASNVLMSCSADNTIKGAPLPRSP